VERDSAALGVKNEIRESDMDAEAQAVESTQGTDGAQDAPQEQAQSPAGAQNTGKPSPEPVPYERFQEVTRKLREFEKQAQGATEAQRKAEEQRLAEQKQFEQLWQQEKAARAEIEQRLRESELAQWRQQAAMQVSLPATLADRLRGDTLDDMIADAKALAATLPKVAAPNVNGAPGDGGAPRAASQPWALLGLTKDEFAARYNLNARYLEG
jgi:hypothetical protein